MVETGALILATLLTIPNGFGINIHFTGEPHDLDLIAEAGFKYIRMDFGWGGIEREKGVYNFSAYDALTKGFEKRGISMLYILDYSNNLYEDDRSVRSEKGREAFAKFGATAAKRYEGKQILWEIWNEPNIKQFWVPQPDIDSYTALVEAASKAIKEAVPSAIVVAPATSGIPFTWLEECFQKGMLKWIDALTVHPYRPNAPETVIKDYQELRKLLKKYAPDKDIPIISGEWGYSNINWDKNPLSDETQAQYLVREFLVNYLMEIPVNIWYDWKNDGTDASEREHNFGTVTNDLKPKPAYLAMKALAHLLEGYSIVERLDLGSDEDFALKLKKGESEAVACWTMGDEHEIKLPAKMEGTLFSMLGEKKSDSWSGDKITLSQSPQYLIIK